MACWASINMHLRWCWQESPPGLLPWLFHLLGHGSKMRQLIPVNQKCTLSINLVIVAEQSSGGCGGSLSSGGCEVETQSSYRVTVEAFTHQWASWTHYSPTLVFSNFYGPENVIIINTEEVRVKSHSVCKQQHLSTLPTTNIFIINNILLYCLWVHNFPVAYSDGAVSKCLNTVYKCQISCKITCYCGELCFSFLFTF